VKNAPKRRAPSLRLDLPLTPEQAAKKEHTVKLLAELRAAGVGPVDVFVLEPVLQDLQGLTTGDLQLLAGLPSWTKGPATLTSRS
jgi:hypothetical protein